ncbi:hypothetical protein BN1708_020209, partial [Verticillium longisporum]
IIVSAR